MARSPSSLPGAHVLAWSSPLLLLVLLFTVSARSPAPTPSLTTTSAAPAAASTTSTRPATTTTRPAAHPTTTVPPSVAAIDSSVRSPARALSVSAASGVLAGTLTPGFSVAVVPLRGPGAWSLTGSATISASLYCPSVSGPVVGSVVISGSQSCQLELASTNVEASPTWLLTPVH